MEEKDIHLKSEEVQEILGTPPNSIVRWGVTIIFLVIAMLLTLSYIIKYPDIVKGSALITTQNPPIKISSYTNGIIQELFISDKDSVSSNQSLALIESTAEYADVNQIENLIYKLDTTADIKSILFKNRRKSMGEIQAEYNNFLSAYNALIFFYDNNIEDQTNKSIQGQISQLRSKQKKLLNQKHLLKQEIDILEKQLNERKKLLDKKIISNEDYESSKVEYFQKKQQFENLKMSVSDNKIAQSNLKNNISNNSFTRVFKDNEIVMKFEESKDLLISKINWWKKKYLITSPIPGHISFNESTSKNYKVNQSEQIFTIIPEKNNIIAKVLVPLSYIGKLDENQKILINLLSYPSAEFGYIESKISSISLVPNGENKYLIKAKLPEELVTSYGKKIEFKTEMQGTASIITSKKRVITRIFEKFRDLSDTK